MENKNKNEYPPFPNVFFEDLEMYAPLDIKKYGYQLKPGMSYRLYSGAEIRDRIKDGTVIPLKKRPSKAKKTVETEALPSAIPAPVPKPPMTEEQLVAQWQETDKRFATTKVTHALERWDVESESVPKILRKRKVKLQPLSKEEKEHVRWLFQVLSFSLEWNDITKTIVIKAHEKPLAGPPPEYKPSILACNIMRASRRMRAK